MPVITTRLGQPDRSQEGLNPVTSPPGSGLAIYGNGTPGTSPIPVVTLSSNIVAMVISRLLFT
jgi:hypothetical protein